MISISESTFIVLEHSTEIFEEMKALRETNGSYEDVDVHFYRQIKEHSLEYTLYNNRNYPVNGNVTNFCFDNCQATTDEPYFFVDVFLDVITVETDNDYVTIYCDEFKNMTEEEWFQMSLVHDIMKYLTPNALKALLDLSSTLEQELS